MPLEPEAGAQAADGVPRRSGTSTRRPQISLRARALKLLAMREHSRQELSRKLAMHAESQEQLLLLISDLEQSGYLSEQRFAESLVRRRGNGRGASLVAAELQQHGIDPELSGPLLKHLQSSELERAQSAWRRKFHGFPSDFTERVKQQRYLMQRGFSTETIARFFRAMERGELEES